MYANGYYYYSFWMKMDMIVKVKKECHWEEIITNHWCCCGNSHNFSLTRTDSFFYNGILFLTWNDGKLPTSMALLISSFLSLLNWISGIVFCNLSDLSFFAVSEFWMVWVNFPSLLWSFKSILPLMAVKLDGWVSQQAPLI
jgi:hypothetical protein